MPDEMAADFTYDAYRGLLDAAIDAGYPFLTVRKYLAEPSPPERFVIVRHDVDRKPRNAVDMANFEAARGIETTYYVRTVDGTFEPALLREIASLGHEIGYHYEDLDRADGNPVAGRRAFAHNLALIRSIATVETVCMHGNPLTPHDNRDLWSGHEVGDRGSPEAGALAWFGLLGEAYLSIDYEDVAYFSDTGRTWRDGPLKVKDRIDAGTDRSFGVAGGVETTDDLVALLENRAIDRACLLVHPNRWAGSTPELVVEWLTDTAINAVKRGLRLSERHGSTPGNREP